MNTSPETRGLVRSLRRDPTFLAASVLTMSLGIGAATAVFSLVKAVLLAPLPWPEPERLVLLWNRPPDGSASLGFSPRELEGLGGAEPVEALAGFVPGGANLVQDGRARQLWVTGITPGAFGVLGVRPIHGRDFRPEDHEGSRAVILSHELWSEAFGSDPGAVGRVIRFDGAAQEIVGVLPPDVAMPTDYRWSGKTEIWSPIERSVSIEPSMKSRPFWVVGRLRAGASPESARPALETAHRRIQSSSPEAYPGGTWRLEVVPVETEVLGSARRTLAMLSIAVALVLAVAASNQALLIAARGEKRRRELAVRSALGASPGRLAAHGLLEAVAVAAFAVAAGLALAGAAVGAVPSLAPGAFPRSDRVALDPGVVAFAIVLALAVALVAGARESRRQRRRSPWEALVAGRTATGSAGGATRLLLALEVALSTVLVAGSALLLQSHGNLRRTPLGFEPAGVVTGDIVLPEERYRETAEIFAFFEQVRERARRLPGVEHVGWTTTVPFWNPAAVAGVEIESGTPAPGSAPVATLEAIGPGLVKAVGTPLLRGRDVEETDREGAPLIAMVNRAFEQRFWPEGSALGHRVRLPGEGSRPWLTIVGVLENARDQAVSEAPRPRISIPVRQLPEAVGRPPRYLSLMARVRGDAAALIGPLRAVVASVDGEVPLGAARPLASEVRSALSRPRLAARLTSAFAVGALFLVLAGLYGLLSSSVTRRFREIGIRLALGASRRAVLRLVFRDGLAPVAAGLAAGVAGAAGAERLVRSLLYGVEGTNPVSLLAAVTAILGAALVSAALPALRALRVDPAITLRSD